MSIFSFLFSPKPASAVAAKERLQILLAHERAGNSFDFLPQLKSELLAVIRKYVPIDDRHVNVRLDRESDISILEVNVELPQPQMAGR